MSEPVLCSWCLNNESTVIDGRPYCTKCSHRADVMPEQCDCLMCSAPTLAVPPVPELVPPVPDLTLTVPPYGVPVVEDGLRFKGRGFVRPVINWLMMGSRMVLRVDCEHNSAAWAELSISEELVAIWARQLAEHDPEEEAELAEQFPEDDTPTPVA